MEIYELLNDVTINLEDYEQEKLSAIERKRIKRRILRELRKGKGRQAQWKSSIAVACICLSLGIGGVGVAASTGLLPVPDIFKTIFTLDTKEKVNIANDIGGAVNVIAEDNGYKITAEGILRDENHIKVIYKIEKSNGESLGEKDEICTNVDFHNGSFTSWQSGVLETVEQKYNAYSIEYCTSWSILDDISKKKSAEASLENMILWFDEKKVEIKGTWNFVIPIETKTHTIDLAEKQKISYEEYHAQIKELKISPIGYSVKIISSDELSHFHNLIKMIDGQCKIRLKNGKEIDMNGASGVTDNQDNTHTFYITGSFEKIILFRDMEQIMIGDKAIDIVVN